LQVTFVEAKLRRAENDLKSRQRTSSYGKRKRKWSGQRVILASIRLASLALLLMHGDRMLRR
jgi:hypothetical protein